jgi:predicted  nucleic acid-binding Zn-ribbon protein
METRDELNAGPEVQLRLLDLQVLDSATDRLAHRRANLPEAAEVAELTAAAEAAGAAAAGAETEDSDLARAQRKIEADVDQVRTRVERDRTRLDTGQVSSPRELENLQSELVSLARRQSDLEDQVLEVMEQREEIQGRLARHRGEAEELTGRLRDAERRRDEALRSLDADAGGLVQQRTELLATLPAELLALYEKIRQTSGGVGAAALRRGRCEGCHLQLNTVELNELRMAADDAVLRCDECRRILVRIPESGL